MSDAAANIARMEEHLETVVALVIDIEEGAAFPTAILLPLIALNRS